MVNDKPDVQVCKDETAEALTKSAMLLGATAMQKAWIDALTNEADECEAEKMFHVANNLRGLVIRTAIKLTPESVIVGLPERGET